MAVERKIGRVVKIVLTRFYPPSAYLQRTRNYSNSKKTVLELQIRNLELQMENASYRARLQYGANAKPIEEIKAQISETGKPEK